MALAVPRAANVVGARRQSLWLLPIINTRGVLVAHSVIGNFNAALAVANAARSRGWQTVVFNFAVETRIALVSARTPSGCKQCGRSHGGDARGVWRHLRREHSGCGLQGCKRLRIAHLGKASHKVPR